MTIKQADNMVYACIISIICAQIYAILYLCASAAVVIARLFTKKFHLILMALWFSCKIKYAIQHEDGKQTLKSEQYLVDAVSFTEAEARLYMCLSSTVPEFMLTSISKMNLADIFHFDDAEVWYKCKIVYVSVDEKTGKEKKVPNTMLVSAHNAKMAYERVEESLSTMIVPFEITDVNLTSIIEIFPYIPEEKPVASTVAATPATVHAVQQSAIASFEEAGE